MRFSAPTAALLALAPLLSAQQQTPYSEGSVDDFLAEARSKGRASIVLFNFDADTG